MREAGIDYYLTSRSADDIIADLSFTVLYRAIRGYNLQYSTFFSSKLNQTVSSVFTASIDTVYPYTLLVLRLDQRIIVFNILARGFLMLRRKQVTEQRTKVGKECKITLLLHTRVGNGNDIYCYNSE